MLSTEDQIKAIAAALPTSECSGCRHVPHPGKRCGQRVLNMTKPGTFRCKCGYVRLKRSLKRS